MLSPFPCTPGPPVGSIGERTTRLHTQAMTKKEIIEALAIVAPSIAIHTEWQFDPDARWDGDATLPPSFVPWRSEVTATCIHNGQPITGNAYLGGTWEEYGDNPEESNPDISGYFPQMVVEAIEELQAQLVGPGSNRLRLQTVKALNALKA